MDAWKIKLSILNETTERLYARMVEEKIAARYSIGEQISILRRRDENPEAFAAFYDFAEACKAEARAEINAVEDGMT